MLLLGASGSGKSIFTKYLKNYLLAEFKYIFPFQCELTKIKKPFENLIEEVMQKYEIDFELNKEILMETECVFIIDGYDEILGERNIYTENFFSEKLPKAKVILTCRDEYLSTKKIHENFEEIFYPLTPGISKDFLQNEIKAKKENFFKLYLRNFSEKQVNSYIENFVSHSKNLDYMKKFDEELSKLPLYANVENNVEKCFKDVIFLLAEEIPLIKSAFLLEIICKLIPQNESFQNKEKLKEMKRFTIYKMFLNILFTKEFERRKESLYIEKIKFKGVLDKQKIKEIINFTENLAADLYKELLKDPGFLINFESENFSKYNLTDPKTKFFRISAENTVLDEIKKGKWNFTHKSILEFFISKRIINEIKHFNKNMIYEKKEILQNEYLINKIQIQDNISLINFIVDYIDIDSSKIFEEKLWDVIYLTKFTGEKNNTILDLFASNCLTILNYANKIFFNRNFEGLRFPYADLSQSLISNCNFENCFMPNCNLTLSSLIDNSFKNAELDNIQMGGFKKINIKEEIRNNGYIQNMKISPQGNYMAISFYKGFVNLYEIYPNNFEFYKISTIDFKDINGETNEDKNIEYLNFSGDEKYLIVGAKKNFLAIYDINASYIYKTITTEGINGDINICDFTNGKKENRNFLMAAGSYIYNKNFELIEDLSAEDREQNEKNCIDTFKNSFSPCGRFIGIISQIKLKIYEIKIDLKDSENNGNNNDFNTPQYEFIKIKEIQSNYYDRSYDEEENEEKENNNININNESDIISNRLTSFIFSPTEKLLAISYFTDTDCYIEIFSYYYESDIKDDKITKLSLISKEKLFYIQSFVKFSDDGKYLVATDKRSNIKLINVQENFSNLIDMNLSDQDILSTGFYPGNRFIIFCSGTEIMVYDYTLKPKSSKKYLIENQLNGNMERMTLAKNLELFGISSRQKFVIYEYITSDLNFKENFNGLKFNKILNYPGFKIEGGKFSTNNKLLALGIINIFTGRQLLQIFDINNRYEFLWEYERKIYISKYEFFNNDNYLLIFGKYPGRREITEACIFDIKNNFEKIYTFDEDISDYKISPSGKFLAVLEKKGKNTKILVLNISKNFEIVKEFKFEKDLILNENPEEEEEQLKNNKQIYKRIHEFNFDPQEKFFCIFIQDGDLQKEDNQENDFNTIKFDENEYLDFIDDDYLPPKYALNFYEIEKTEENSEEVYKFNLVEEIKNLSTYGNINFLEGNNLMISGHMKYLFLKAEKKSLEQKSEYEKTYLEKLLEESGQKEFFDYEIHGNKFQYNLDKCIKGNFSDYDFDISNNQRYLIIWDHMEFKVYDLNNNYELIMGLRNENFGIIGDCKFSKDSRFILIGYNENILAYDLEKSKKFFMGFDDEKWDNEMYQERFIGNPPIFSSNSASIKFYLNGNNFDGANIGWGDFRDFVEDKN